MGRPIGSVLAAAGLAAFLAASAPGEGEIKTTPHPDDKVWMADGEEHRVGVYADNTGVSPGPHTDGVQWYAFQHPTFTLDHYRGFEIPSAEQDFFGGAETEDLIFGLGENGSGRMTLDQAAGPSVGEGRGFLAFYNFEVPRDTQLGRYHFTLDLSPRTRMFNEGGSEQQPVNIGYDFITVIPDLNTMAADTLGPGVPIESEHDYNEDGFVDMADWARAQVDSSEERD
ncbi:MAG: hypothetical protein ABH864_03810 [archaeon]